MKRLFTVLAVAFFAFFAPFGAFAQSNVGQSASVAQVITPIPASPNAAGQGNAASGVSLNINFSTGAEGENYSVAVQLLIFMTLLTLAPSIIMLTTCFTRIVIVLGFVGKAIGTSGVPSSQILVGIALFLTFFIMGPVWNKINDEAIVPYRQHVITSERAYDIAAGHMKNFMLKQTNPNDLEFFLGLANMGPTTVKELPLRIVIPSFILGELRRSFEMGFLIYVPFLIIDFIIASTLMSMGMMMMPPTVISLPFKLLLFVLVDGWTLVVKSLVMSFNM
jgi:flagellar biosynthesis protein FliP